MTNADLSTPSQWASITDLEARWRPLTEAEKTKAQSLIVDAMSLIKDECPTWEAASVESRRRVVCQMVRRAMQSALGDDTAVGVSQASMTAGPYTQAVTFANPGGDLYMTKAERRAIRGSRRRAFEADLLAGREAL